jgi:hypothetical protein
MPGHTDREAKAVKQTMLFGSIGGILIGVHSEQAPSRADWGAWVAFTEANAKSTRAILVLTEGAGPNGTQRAKMAKVKEVLPFPTAIVTHSAIARGIATAFAWIGKNVRAFSPDQLGDALLYLTVPAASQPELLSEVASMRVRIPGGSIHALSEMTGNASERERLMRSVVSETFAQIRERLRAAS